MSQTIDIRIYAFLTLTTIPPVNSKTNIYQSLCVCVCVCVCIKSLLKDLVLKLKNMVKTKNKAKV